jgi:hypothetical protein
MESRPLLIRAPMVELRRKQPVEKRGKGLDYPAPWTIAKSRGEVVSDNPVHLTQREHFYKGLRLTGVPET